MAVTPAELVRRAREDAGLSQRELAARSGLRQPNLAAIETGARVPSETLLARVLQAAELRPSIPLELYAERIHEIASAYGIHDVRVFGSTARGTDTADSDVDLLITVDDDVDFLSLAAFRQEVAELIGFPVDAVVDDPDDPVAAMIHGSAVPL
ncbi:helix-turn-helix domain-containing protein [Agromyces sp. CFH 90414]|uniref:Helix-turn-helix domain-containing protein n=1 Tax=Agromyces agglutinans TaxID=2662258 RepID=A0A6I2F9E6_9MICO|nr:nucleotidyltransferase domain-containing protein [Agromyces agglutinans]MRG60397.1 helix-turn-helix domain-containing protein [Agromyces agglutinans]